MSIRDWRHARRQGQEREGERGWRAPDEERFGSPEERRCGTPRSEGRFAWEEERPRREKGTAGRTWSGDWVGGLPTRAEPRGRNAEEGFYPHHPMSHRYRGYEEEPPPFTGPPGTDVRREGSTALSDTWGFGGGTSAYTGWGAERYGSEGYRGRFGGFPTSRLDENETGGTAFPPSHPPAGLTAYFPAQRTAPRRGRGPRSYQRSDERIREEVNERLMVTWMNSEDVDVRVDAGEVTLTGFVDTREEKRAVEDVAADVLGVKDVHNQLRVDPERRLREQEKGRLTEEEAARH